MCRAPVNSIVVFVVINKIAFIVMSWWREERSEEEAVSEPTELPLLFLFFFLIKLNLLSRCKPRELLGDGVESGQGARSGAGERPWSLGRSQLWKRSLPL